MPSGWELEVVLARFRTQKSTGSIMESLGDSVNDIEESGDSVYIATNSGLIRITNKKIEDATNLYNQDMAYGKLKALQPKPSEIPLGFYAGKEAADRHKFNFQ